MDPRQKCFADHTTCKSWDLLDELLSPIAAEIPVRLREVILRKEVSKSVLILFRRQVGVVVGRSAVEKLDHVVASIKAKLLLRVHLVEKTLEVGDSSFLQPCTANLAREVVDDDLGDDVLNEVDVWLRCLELSALDGAQQGLDDCFFVGVNADKLAEINEAFSSLEVLDHNISEVSQAWR